MNIEKVTTLTLNDNDFLLIQLPEGTTRQEICRFQQALANRIPNKMHKIMVYVGDIQFLKLSMEIHK